MVQIEMAYYNKPRKSPSFIFDARDPLTSNGNNCCKLNCYHPASLWREKKNEKE